MKPVDEVAGDAMSLLVTAGRKLRSVSLAAARITATVALLAGFESAVAQDQSAEIAFLIDLNQLSRLVNCRNPHLSVLVTFSNTLLEKDRIRSLALTADDTVCTLASVDNMPNSPITIGKGGTLSKDGAAISYNRANIRVAYAEASGTEQIEIDDNGIARISQIRVPWGQYRIKYHLTRKTFRSETDSPYYAGEQTILAYSNQVQDVIIRKPSFIESISDIVITKEGGITAAFLSLITALLAALRKHFDKGALWVLDILGRYGTWSLARRRFERIYREYMISNHKYLRLIGFNVSGIPRPLLEDVYISLKVSSYSMQFGVQPTKASEADSVSFAEAVRKFPRLVILGAPGAGKTTTLSFILLQFAKGNGQRSFGIRERLYPIYIPLRRLSVEDSTIVNDLLDPRTQILSQEIISEYPKTYFEHKLDRGECVVLFDGLDEVTSESVHQSVAKRINDFVSRYHKNRFIVTCRVAGWRNLLPDFAVLEAEDLSRDEIHRFIRGWHTAVIGLQERNRMEQERSVGEIRAENVREHASRVKLAIDDYSRRLINAIDGNARILSVATNPMLLSLICLVHLNRNILPRGRAILYGQCVEFLVDAWERSKGVIVSQSKITLLQKEVILRQLAYELQMSGKGELKRSSIEELIERIAVRNAISIPPRELLEDIERRSGLLVERSIDVLGFSHLTLQEYLVAKHVQLNPSLLSTLLMHLDDPEWREVVLLYAGLVDDPSELAARIIKDGRRERFLLAGHAIGEGQRTDQDVARRVIAPLLEMLKEDEQLQNIEAAISALASMATDFGSEGPNTLEQGLSNTLVGWVSNNDHRSSAAIVILGRARITRALPLLVDLMLKDNELREPCIRSVVLFGNLALETIDNAVRKVGGREVPVEFFLEPLVAINTGLSALSMIKLYQQYIEVDDRRMISLALSNVIERSIVLAELIDITGDELAGISMREPVAREFIRSAGVERKPSDAFLRLYDIMVADMARVIGSMSTGHKWTQRVAAKPPAFLVTFPALVESIHGSDLSISDETFEVLGFDVARLRNGGGSTENLCRAVRKESFNLQTMIRSISRSVLATTGSFRGGMTHNVLKNSITSAITVVYYLNVVTCAYFGWEIWDNNNAESFEVEAIPIVVMLLGGVLLYCMLLGASLLNYRQSLGVKTIFHATLAPVQSVLQKITYLMQLSPLLVFSMFMLILLIFSFPGAVVYVMLFLDGIKMETINVIGVGGGVVFIMLCALYYWGYLLKLSATTLLLLLHPRGVEFLESLSD